MTHRPDDNRSHVHLARYKGSGETFEVVIDPDKAAAYKAGEINDAREVVEYEKIFSDAKRGLLSSKASIEKVFGTTDNLMVIDKILHEGSLQLSQQHREKQVEDKHKQIASLIQRNAVDPRTKLPHPQTRIENALAQAKVKINPDKSALEQLNDIVQKLRPILPIHFETKKLNLIIPSQFAQKTLPLLKSTTIVKESWYNDGTHVATIEIPAGIYQDITDRLNTLTHGDIDITEA